MNIYHELHKNDPEYKSKNSERARLWYKNNQLKIKEYKIRNREQILKAQKEYHESNRVRRLKYKREYYRKNQKVILEKARQYRVDNPDKVKDSAKRWALAHMPEVLMRNRARSAKIIGHPIKKEDIANWYTKICGICNELIEDKFHIDHKTPLSRGGLHVVENLQLTHPHCNQVKYNKLSHEMSVV